MSCKQAALSQNEERGGPNAGVAHYWSYRALLEDKRRCLTNIPVQKFNPGNTLEAERQNCKTSHNAIAEMKKHVAITLDKKQDWDPNGAKTPPHRFQSDENRPHYSQKDIAEKKKNCQTVIRRPASARPRPVSRADSDQYQDEWEGGKKRSAKDIAQAKIRDDGVLLSQRKYFEAPTMNMLMHPGQKMCRKHNNEREALQERRSSSVPHDSLQALTWKKKYHATKIHTRKPQRAQSARALGRSDSGVSDADSNPDSNFNGDPATKSYQGAYPYGNSSEAWPEGRTDPKQPGRYRSQAYLMVDKRRHCAAIDGDTATTKDKSRDAEDCALNDEESHLRDRLQYRSQNALAQHKRRHLVTLNEDADWESRASPRTPYADGTMKQDLFTSQKTLEYGKRGHVVTLNSARELVEKKRIEARNEFRSRGGSVASSVASTESSCDVGKGISRMMHKHNPDVVHDSQSEFALKKKNHATCVHIAPRPKGEKSPEENELECKSWSHELRRDSIPHVSSRAFALKKKYHQTTVHAEKESRLHPESKVRAEKLLDKDSSGVMNSYKHLLELKKLHMFEYDPDSRTKADYKPIPSAPEPRNGQWTPQHVSD